MAREPISPTLHKHNHKLFIVVPVSAAHTLMLVFLQTGISCILERVYQ